ncbi:hypothetical protein DFH08DRAFT_1071368 [Mycena albidolilacea]|uniref:Uncharacterized protein n=1 Tax=Mycena albidolilacea TaxID=1033008 RepID=A0AAD7AVE0_9AGAR|nr:hypothetical protein DFH08DRAFT_1071368 [Mycena albidolilacea]
MAKTRSTSKTRVGITWWFPNEVIEEILIYDLSFPILIRTVILRKYNSAGAFCRALIENPSRADAIHAVTIGIGTIEDLVLQAMKLMHRLEHLDIRYSTCRPMECTFPRLITCDIGLATTYESRWTNLVLFLQRHPHLTRLRIKADEAIAVPEGTSIPLFRYAERQNVRVGGEDSDSEDESSEEEEHEDEDY